MNNQPSKHHYVPVCYLKFFTDNETHLWKRQKDRIKASHKHPSQVCWERDFYKINREDTLLINGIRDRYVVEKEAFKKIENKYGDILTELIKYSQTPKLTDKQDYHIFLEFLVALKRRNPFTKNFLSKSSADWIQKDFSKKGVRDYLKMMSKYVGDEETDVDAYVDSYISETMMDPQKTDDMYLSAFLNKVDSVSISVVKDLYRYKQFFLFAPAGTEFITSDNPGFTVVGDTVMMFGGFGSPFHFYFPLAPNCCLLIDSSRKEETIIEKVIYPVIITESIVSEINGFTKQTANKDIFGYTKNYLEKV